MKAAVITFPGSNCDRDLVVAVGADDCVVGVRAEPFAPGADEWLALEVHMMQRAAGMPLEGVSVRP